MPYTVTWLDAATDELATCWMNNPSMSFAIKRASNKIDHILRHAPATAGFPCSEGRVFVVSPLCVVYEFAADDCLVTVKELYFHP